MKRLMVNTCSGGFACAAMMLVQQAAAVCVVSLDQVTPMQHDVGGGGVVYLYGTGFCPGLEVVINGQYVQQLTYYNSMTMAGRVPANAAGTYDVLVRDAQTHVVLDTLPMGIQYVVGKLPAPEDFFAVRLDDNRVKLTWSNLVNNDTILVLRNSQTLIALPGGTTSYVDNNAPYTGQSIRYSLIGTAPGGQQSFTASAENIPVICYEHLGLGATGRAGDFLISLLGLAPGDEDAQICFRLAAPADALRVTVHALRYSLHGQLKARIHPANNPANTLATITFTQFDELLRDADWTKGYTGTPLAAGDYILGFFIDGDPGEVFLYAITADAAPEDARGLMLNPCVPPPYPLVKIEPICGNVPPNIISITTEIVAEWAHGDLRDPNPGGFFGGVLPLGDRRINLHCEAEDVDGGKSIRYVWHFGHGDPGSTHESGSPSVTHEFPAYQTYHVTCTVFDNAGAFDSQTIEVVVTPLAFPCPADGPACITTLSSPNSPAGSDGNPAALSFLPDIDAFLAEHVVQTYQVQVTPPEESFVNSVRMKLLDPNTGLCINATDGSGCMQDAATNLNPGHAFDPANWESTFNTDQIPNIEDFDVEVTAHASNGTQAVRVFPNMPLCDRPFWADASFNGIVATTIEHDDATHIYGLSSEMPPNPIYEETFTIPLPGGFDIDLYNKLVAGAFFDAELQNDWLPGPLRFDFQATLLGEELASEHKEFELWPPGIVRFPCDSFGIHYHEDNVSIYDQEWEWELFSATIYNGLVGPIPVSAEVSVDVGLGVDVKADVDVLLQVASPHVDATATLTPTVTAWADANLEVEVLFGIASATGTLRPSIGISLPVTLDIEDTNLSVGVTDCLTVSLEAKVRACLFLAGCVSSGWMDIFSDSFGNGCPAGALAPCSGELLGPAGQPEPESPELKYPAISISPDGSKTMVVYTRNVAPNPDIQYNAELYYALDSGAGYSPPAPLYSPADSFTQRDSNVVFLSNTTALAVWTESRLTHAQESALDRSTVAGMNSIFKNQDIAFATWTAAGGWAAKQFLVSDATPNPILSDGRPAVAPILNNVANPNSAWVVWVRSDNTDLLDGIGHVKLSGMSVYARKIFNGVPSGSIIKLSAGDEANPAADVQPDVAVSPSGNVALAVWVRDQDSDFDTSTDRMLMYSVWFGGTWSAPAAVTAPTALPGVLMPSVALSSDVNGMIAFTVRDSRYNGSVLEVTGDGNRDAVYAIRIVNTAFQPAVPLQRLRNIRNGTLVRHQGHDRDGRVYGRNPVVRYLDTNNPIVVFRSFDGYGSQGGDGELAVASIDLSQATPQWSLARDLTSDAYRDWEIAAAVGPNNMIRTVRDSASPTAGVDGITTQAIPVTPDIALDRVRVANQHTPAGNQVTLTAVLRNNGLRTPSVPQSTYVRFGKVVNNVFQQIAAVPVLFTAPPDQTQTVAYTLWMPVGATAMRAIVDAIPGEADLTNNSADVMLGVLPPLNLQCSDASQASGTEASLTWKNGELYDSVAVYRDGRLLAVLPAGRESYVDRTVGLGAHLWSVRGRIAAADSDPDVASCGLTFFAAMDFDHDGDVDQQDLEILEACASGPAVPRNGSPVCQQADFDADNDVDQSDFGLFQRCLSGENVPANPNCGN